jgi:hypothetical protein
MQYTYQQVLTIIDAIEAQNYELNSWEKKFINSILEQRNNLSFKQSECLFKIYEKSIGDSVFVKRQYFR